MSEITYRLPSKDVQYGYAEVRGTAEELAAMDMELQGRLYVAATIAFRQGEMAQMKAAFEPPKPDRLAEALGQVLEDERKIKASLHERNIAATPMEPQAAEEEVKKLGATVVESDAPWNNADMTPAAPKPWEKKVSKPIKTTADISSIDI